jgi:hypothetical protein
MRHFLVVSDNGHVSPMSDSGGIQAGIAALHALCRTRVDAQGRRVSNAHAVSLKLLARHFDSALGTMRQDAAEVLREDDFSAGLGAFNPRDLTYRFKAVLEERLPPLNAMTTFPVNTEVPPGALHYEQYRAYSTGEAVVYRGGSGADVPEVGIGQATARANVAYLISKASVNWLEQLRIGFTGLDTQARKMRAARRVIDELENKWAWNGSEANGLFGMLNHPYCDTALSTVAYQAATASDDIAADFAMWANYAENESASTFQPNTLLIAPKLANALRNRAYGDNADKSLLQWMLDANPHIKTVKTVRELNDAGGAGIHAMVFVRAGASTADTSVEIIKPMMATLLPPEQRALSSDLYLVSAFGGLNQREVGDNLVVYVEGDA